MNDLVGVAGELRVWRPWPRLRRLLRIALANQGVEVRENRGRDQQRIILVPQVRFVSQLISKQADHQIRGIARPRINKCPLLRQLLICPVPCADKSRYQHGRACGVHERKPDRLDEAARIIQRAHRFSIQMPLLTTELVEFEIGHKSKLQAPDWWLTTSIAEAVVDRFCEEGAALAPSFPYDNTTH